MAATAKDDATATYKGDDDSIFEKDFGQEANQDKAKAKSDDAKASGKTSGKVKDDAAKNLGKDADGEAGSDKDHKDAFVSSKKKVESTTHLKNLD